MYALTSDSKQALKSKAQKAGETLADTLTLTHIGRHKSRIRKVQDQRALYVLHLP